MGYLFQSVDVHQSAARNLAYVGVDIARHSNVDQKNRPALALSHESCHIIASNDVVWASRRTDHNVSAAHRLPNLTELDRQSAQFFCQSNRMRVSAIAHQYRGNALGNEVARRQFAHLARADYHRRFFLQTTKSLLRQLDGGGTDGHGSFRHVGLRADTFGGVKHAVKNRLKRVAARVCFLRDEECLFNLTQNLGLADDQRIQTGRYPKEMAERL